jgi:hypothetical protein
MLFSDSEDDLSSDTQSFDMDDLYGSDSGIETFSLAPHSDAQVRMTSEQTVCNFPNYTHSGLLTFKQVQQDGDMITQFDRMEMNMQDASLMLQAICEAQGIDVSATLDTVQDQSLNVSSGPITSDVPSQLERGGHDDCDDDSPEGEACNRK